ncbi:MAG: hypothetical protein ACREJV_12565 [Candidatus Rokuibacteriota bacterium]
MLRALRLAKGLGVVIVAAAVLSLSADRVGGIVLPAGGGAKVIVITGKGRSVHSNGTTSIGITGDCRKVRVVAASAAIANGVFDNTITATATCGTLTVDATATDPGSGDVAYQADELVQNPAPGANARNPMSCVHTYFDPGTLTPDSRWTISCTFLFFPPA